MKGMIVCCFITVLAISCKSAKESVSLTGVKWVAESLNGKEIKFKEAQSEVFFTLDATDKKVSGKAGYGYRGFVLQGVGRYKEFRDQKRQADSERCQQRDSGI